jgi:hypothetical protein
MKGTASKRIASQEKDRLLRQYWNVPHARLRPP